MFLHLETFLKGFAAYIALGVETIAALIIAGGSCEAVYTLIRHVMFGSDDRGIRKTIWMRYASWLVLGLEFELAADILRTGIAPTWTEIGQLAAIAAIRTFLNYFLEKDIESTTAAI